jgi:hypothetical protein
VVGLSRGLTVGLSLVSCGVEARSGRLVVAPGGRGAWQIGAVRENDGDGTRLLQQHGHLVWARLKRLALSE